MERDEGPVYLCPRSKGWKSAGQHLLPTVFDNRDAGTQSGAAHRIVSQAA